MSAVPPVSSRFRHRFQPRLRWLPPAIALLLLLSPSRPASSSPLIWHNTPGYRYAELPAPAPGPPGFDLLPPSVTGINFSNLLSNPTLSTNRLYEIGSGVALGDIDGDGLVDLYLTGLENGNRLYRNLGNWRFQDITASAGVACHGQFSTGAVLVDLDGDGDLDLLVNGFGTGTRAFFNDGTGRFTERDVGLAPTYGATSMALADVDGDGDLDLYVTNYRTDTFFDHPRGLRMEMRTQPDGTRILEPRDRFITLAQADGAPMVIERGEPDILYLNRGNGRFAPIPWITGLFLDEDGQPLTSVPTDWGLSVLFRDLNGDGLPDLYVCNDFVAWPDRVWFNEGGRRFRAAPRHAFRSFSLASMAVDAADINRDGHDDLFVADMLSPRRQFRAWQRPDTLKGSVTWPVEDPEFRPEIPRNTLHLARGDGTFAEIATLAGLAATDWTPAALFLDVDLDGWEDLLVTTGNLHDLQDADALDVIRRSGGDTTPAMRRKNLALLPHRATPSLAFRNRRDLTFEEVGEQWGFNTVGVAHGFALADLDNDGDLDLVVNAMNAPARVYRNRASAPRLAVRLRGAHQNTRGIGARITVRGGPVTQSQEMIAGGRYASSDDPMRVFATGSATSLEIEVRWRSGHLSRVPHAQPNRLYEIFETASLPQPAPPPSRPLPLFTPVTPPLPHLHTDAPFDDFARQPLLPRRLSNLGPAVAWTDLDGDRRPDLLVSGGTGGRTLAYRNPPHGGFNELPLTGLPRTNPRDQNALVVAPGPTGAPFLWIGESNWENADPDAAPFRAVPLPTPTPAPPPRLPNWPLPPSATGPLAFADVDGDGVLDLFVGGRAVPGRYPEAAHSFLLRAHAGSWTVAQSFPALGRISGAVFADLDGDGRPDLALASEWDSIRLFLNRDGRLVEATTEFGLAPYRGLWNGIAAGDFDGDGQLDLVATNWGRNGRPDLPGWHPSPILLYHGDFAGDGSQIPLLASHDPFLAKVTPWRERKAVIASLPSVAARFPSHRDYGAASIHDLLGPAASRATRLEATTLDSMLFLHRGNRFEPRPLPIEAQFAPAFGVAVADFDGDGHEDLFLAQNFFGTDVETARQDAGTGLLLLGDGQGGFRALPPAESGIALHGEQRGTAGADFDGDGRPDLAVAQYRSPLTVLRNTRGQPGVRISLAGPPANPDAIGVILQLRFGKQLGPARGLHAGSGYGSQDHTTLVLAAPIDPAGLLIRWPDGTRSDLPWPSGARSVRAFPNRLQPD
ncbi:MAG: VCBS repeat-containing protein [Verrucomicrobiae bacterium]|nr:VCBS repeat-containing protein [Verrucomicrobiae bacterium]